MPRPPRELYNDALYHVFTRGNFRQDMFLAATDFEAFLGLIQIVHERYDFCILSYCLMSNHYHLLVSTPKANLPECMQYLNGVYAMGFNSRYNRYGHVMHGRYNYRLIENESYLRWVARYIVLNPVEAGMVSQPQEWHFSSYRGTVDTHYASAFLDRDGLLTFFGDAGSIKPCTYLEYVDDSSARELGFDEDLVLVRPILSNIFSTRTREAAVNTAVLEWSYTLREVASYMKVSYSTVRRLLIA